MTSIKAMQTELAAMHAPRQRTPTSEQFRVNAIIAIKTMIQALPQSWVRDFDFPLLGPLQKKAFKDIVASWEAEIENNIAARLGEQPQQKEVA